MCESILKRMTCLRLTEDMSIDSDDECTCERCVFDYWCDACGVEIRKDNAFIHLGGSDEVYCLGCFAKRGCN